jgi:hypothetical protein
MLRLVGWISVITSALAVVGCGTIVHGSRQNVTINSDPSGATITLDNGTVLTTPSSIRLERDTDYVATITKDGYQSQTIPINSVLSGWLAGNIIFGGIIGGGVDAATGAAYTLTPNKLNLKLTPLAPGQVAAAPPTGKLTTQQKLDALEGLKADGMLTEKEYKASKAKLQEDLKKEVTGQS